MLEPQSSRTYSLGKLTRRRADKSRYWSYCIVWWEAGQRKRQSLGATDLIAAEALARIAWASLARLTELVTVGDFVQAYLGAVDRPDPVPDHKRKREAWVAAKAFWSGLIPCQVDEGVSLAYPHWRQRSPNTHRAELSLVRSALTWAVNNNYLEKAPKITLPSLPPSSVQHLPKEQFRAFLAACTAPHVALFSMLAVTTGGRKSALLQARWSQVDLERGVLDLNQAGRVQNSKFRATVPLNDLILPALREARLSAATEYVIEHRGKPLLDIKKGIGAASKRCGIKVHPHMFRHSAAVWMAEDRVPMEEIAAFLGHRDINMTTRVYARFHPEYLRKAAQSLSW